MPSRSYLFPENSAHLLKISEYYHPDAINLKTKSPIPIASVSHLADLIGVRPSLLYWMIKQPSKHYDEFKIKKKNGQFREISAPKVWLKSIQWWILTNILNSYNPAEFVFGFKEGKSPIQNAHYHLGAKHLLNVDVQDFFPSIDFPKVFEAFIFLGFNAAVADALSHLTTYEYKTPQGAPTSPMLSNIVMRGIDLDLKALADESELKYSRYADDMTFSSDKKIDRVLVSSIEKILGQKGLELNPNKTKFMGTGDRMEVTGYVINEAPQLPRKWRNTARGKLKSFLNGNPKNLEIPHIRGIANTVLTNGLHASPKLKELATAVLKQRY